MTIFYRDTIKCQNCGKTSDHERVCSTNAFGSADLDTRPPEMARSTIHAQVQRCPHCNYCAADISETTPDPSGCVQSEAYQNQLKSTEYPNLANAFLCSALVLQSIGRYAPAGWASIKAAWACDDAKNDAAAKRCRSQAVECIRKALSTGQQFVEQPGAEDAVLVDLLRRSEQFEEAGRQAELGISKSPEGIIPQVLEFQRTLIAKQDLGCYRIDQVLGER
jgi:hypothetical protein